MVETRFTDCKNLATVSQSFGKTDSRKLVLLAKKKFNENTTYRLHSYKGRLQHQPKYLAGPNQNVHLIFVALHISAVLQYSQSVSN